MTPFGTSVAREIRTALVPIETASIIDYQSLLESERALLKNALFYVVPTPAIEEARAAALRRTQSLAETIHRIGVQPKGISLEVDRARAEALEAFQDLIDAVADAEPTAAAQQLGIA